MPRKPNNSRYESLSASEREFLRNPPAKVLLANKLSSFAGPPENLEYYKTALLSFEALVKHWKSGPDWIRAFVYFSSSANRSSPRTYATILSQFRNGFYKYVEETGSANKPLSFLTKEFLGQFVIWLNERKQKRSDGSEVRQAPGTSRKFYQVVNLLLEELRLNPTEGVEVPSAGNFQKRAFTDSHLFGQTEILSDPDWKGLLVAANSAALEIRTAVEEDWKLLDEGLVATSNKDANKYSRGSMLCALREMTQNGMAPPLDDIKNFDPVLRQKVAKFGHRKMTMCFAPSVETIFPFVVLMAIYASANTGPLRAFKVSKISKASMFGVDRVVWDFLDGDDSVDDQDDTPVTPAQSRIKVRIEKNRIHGSYTRSFAVDDSDPLSPSSIVDFLLKWTEGIRTIAGKYGDHLFIFATHVKEVRGFYTSQHDGTDTDAAWRHAFKRFRAKYKLPHLNISNIRTTGLNRLDELFNDILAVQVGAGHRRGSSTYKLHYEGDAARLHKHERLASVASTMPRFAKTRGKSDVRGAPDATDTGAATPGWSCVDPYDSQIPGQVSGKLCDAFGMCPACPLTALDHKSSYCMGRALQLREEIDKSHQYLDPERWKVYSPVRTKLDDFWLPMATPAVMRKARLLNLGPIGRLE